MTDEVETDLHEVRDEELLEAYGAIVQPQANVSSIGIALAECGAVGLPQTHSELKELIEKELKERGI